MTTTKGFTVEIYRSNYDGNLNKFNGKKGLTLVGGGMPEMYEPDENNPGIKLVTRNLFGKDYTHAEPIEPGNYAFGGSFVWTSDSRFRDVCPYPVPLHDRQMDLEKRIHTPKSLYSHLKEYPSKTSSGTSYHGITLTASVNELVNVLGEPTYEDNTGEDKVNFEWERETITGNIFTVYDWKEGRAISKDNQIEWHIGGFNSLDEMQAKEEIKAALKSI